MDFNLEDVAEQCDLCGQYLDPGDTDCVEHEPHEIEEHVFRPVGSPERVTVECVHGYHWDLLQEQHCTEDDESFIQYLYMGRAEIVDHIQSLTDKELRELKAIELPMDAPESVREKSQLNDD